MRAFVIKHSQERPNCHRAATDYRCFIFGLLDYALFESILVISHPGYREDFMFLHWFLRSHRLRRRPETFVHAMISRKLFGFLLFLAGLIAPTDILPD